MFVLYRRQYMLLKYKMLFWLMLMLLQDYMKQRLSIRFGNDASYDDDDDDCRVGGGGYDDNGYDDDDDDDELLVVMMMIIVLKIMEKIP